METRALYFKRRAAEQRAAAGNAANLAARSCHLELAEAYDFRGREFAALDSRSESEVAQALRPLAVSPN